MKATLKTTIALILAIALILPLIACSGDTPDAGDNSPAPNITEDATPSPPPPAGITIEEIDAPQPDPPIGKLQFSDIRIYDNYVTVDISGAAAGDTLVCYASDNVEAIAKGADTLWKAANEVYEFDGMYNYFTFHNLKADTEYYIGIANYGSTGDKLVRDANDSAYAARLTTTKLQNLQKYVVHDNTFDAGLTENTEDTIYFTAKFDANPDYLARFDVNDDGVVDASDVTALQGVVDGTYTITRPFTTFEYTGKSARTVRVARGDINKDGDTEKVMSEEKIVSSLESGNRIDQADVDRLQQILNAPDVGYVRFRLYLGSDFDAESAKTNGGLDNIPIIQEKILAIVPSLTQETVISESFTGLDPSVRYAVVTTSGPQKHYDHPFDWFHLITSTADVTP